MSTNRRAERTRLILRPKRAPSRAKARARAARLKVTYRNPPRARPRPRNWTGALDLGRATLIDASTLAELRALFYLAQAVTVRRGSACLRYLIADQLRRDGAHATCEAGGVLGTRCRRNDCASCRSWPRDGTTVPALLAALQRLHDR